MSGEAHRIHYEGGKPVPMGVRAAVVKMSLIVAAEKKGSELSADDVKMVTEVGEFLASEYERIGTANEEQAKQIHQLERKLMEIARLGDVGDGERE